MRDSRGDCEETSRREALRQLSEMGDHKCDTGRRFASKGVIPAPRQFLRIMSLSKNKRTTMIDSFFGQTQPTFFAYPHGASTSCRQGP